MDFLNKVYPKSSVVEYIVRSVCLLCWGCRGSMNQNWVQMKSPKNNIKQLSFVLYLFLLFFSPLRSINDHPPNTMTNGKFTTVWRIMFLIFFPLSLCFCCDACLKEEKSIILSLGNRLTVSHLKPGVHTVVPSETNSLFRHINRKSFLSVTC